MVMIFNLFLILLVSTLIYNHVSAQKPSSIEIFNLPRWATPVLTGKPFTDEYVLSTRLNPFLIQGDFNGDGRNDIAVLITRRADGTRGLAILHAGSSQPIILGAGQSVRAGIVGGDFSWPGAWSVYPKGRPVVAYPGEGPPPQLRGDALMLIWPGSAAAIIYWDGLAYLRYRQGE